jgi:rod shape-determining protein MreD
VIRGPVAVDLVLVAVVYVALTMGPVTGLFCGTAAGLIQDVLVASPVIGIGGLAKTIVGFFAGVIGTQFIVAQPIPRFVVFFGATVLHAVVFMGLYVLLDMRHFGAPYELVKVVAWQAAGNAAVGVVAFQVAELLPGTADRRGAGRNRIRR